MAVPGEFLATTEEFMPSEGTYESEGKIYASIAGMKKEDARRRSVSVIGSEIKKLKRGDIVYGIVQDLYDTVALVRFEPEKKAAASSTYAYLRISEIKRGYVESFRDFLKIGDLIRAKVIEITPLGIYLTLAEKDLGVLKGFCSNCRSELELKGTVLVCPECRNNERRKLPF
ncbi:exosome complex RNA-binding protein Csl4 [Candidatus Micrarchaeota archaeon]|nr:exosome complex RNA-binding protein Csl4 [Candidatus Micrarchaeota archaeon]